MNTHPHFPIGAVASNRVGHTAQGACASPTGEAGAPNLSNTSLAKQPCLECEGQGEVEVMGLDEDRYHWRSCDDCNGTGYAEKPYCEICQGKLTVDLFCTDCDEWASLIYVERISPTRVAL